MKDINGVEIQLGAKAVVMKDHCVNNGLVGKVLAISSLPWLRGEPGARVVGDPEDNPSWSSWLSSKEIAVIPNE